MNYSRKFNNQLNEEVNYDEYNRNNNLVNNIKFNNRYSVDDYNDTVQTNNKFQNLNPSVSMNNNQNYNGNQINYTNNSQDNLNTNNNMNNNINITESNNNMNNFANQTVQMNDGANMRNTLGMSMNNILPTDNNINNFNNGNNNNMQNYNYNNNLNRSQDINVELNDYVKRNFESRGLHVGRMQSPHSIRMAEMERKKSLLNNIQTQISLSKKSKLEELKRRKEEDAKYLRDMVINYPFGRGGGGAPNRDKQGNIITNRRALISDPKYNFTSINVDDDYDEVWGKEKIIGRFYRYNNDNQNNNNNLELQNNTNDINNNIPRTPFYNNNNYNNIPNNTIDNSPNFYNQPPNIRPYSTNPRIMNPSPNYNNRIFVNNTNNDLLYKMKEEENKKLLEIKKRQLEQERENEQILKEIEEIEKEKNEIHLRNSIREQNKLLQSYKDNENNNNNDNDEDNVVENNIYKTNIIENDIIDPDSVLLDKLAIEKINRSEQESRKRLNKEIMRLRDQMHSQQLLLFNQISNLKNETEKANKQREEALKEIERLKDQINKYNEEELKKKYIHHIIINDDGTSRNYNNEISTQTDPPKKEEDPLLLYKLYKRNVEREKYLDELEKLNAIQKSPPSNHEYEKPQYIPETKEEEDDDDLYEIEITKIHN